MSEDQAKGTRALKVAVALDSFKGSLSSLQAGEAVARGVRMAYPEAEVVVRPLADGGEGTAAALVDGLHGVWHEETVAGPLGASVTAAYGLLPDGGAVLEMASAAGITHVPAAARNPLLATTFGVGELIAAAMEKGCRRFLVGIGGSATNDGGAGLLQALGFRFLDAQGVELPRGGAALARLAHIDRSQVLPQLADCSFRVACDVTNPLCGPNGASAVFGPQKGASPDDVARLDAALAHFAAVSGVPSDFPGAGAAGGLGYAFKAFLGAELARGVDIVLAETHFEDVVRTADVVVTGEGRLDAQSAMGKAPQGVARLAKRYGRPVLAFAGCVTPDAVRLHDEGIDAFFPILRTVTTLDEALNVDTAAANLTAAVAEAFRLVKTFRGVR